MRNRSIWHLKSYQKIYQKIARLAPAYHELTDQELQHKTIEFRERLEAGASLDSLLVEAYATVCEADERILGMRPYKSQILCAIVLNQRNIAELATGEGKTLSATMPLYLNGLLGVGTYLITTNDYLVNRDSREMGQVYRWLGLTVGEVTSDDRVKPEDKKTAYQADIIYTTHSSLGFDFLLDNLAANSGDQNIVRFRYALIDEVDSVLLDLAQTPLVISGAPKVQSNLFKSADRVVKNLVYDRDFKLSQNHKDVWFTENGLQKITTFFGVDSLLNESSKELFRHLMLALRANTLLTLNRDYVVDNGKVMLLDSQDGREMKGMHLEAGMHQALEAKEDVEITRQNRTMASITYQNLFRMFPKLAGMTGTAKTDKREFLKVYNLAVVQIPPHRPNIRHDHQDRLYVNTQEKLMASIKIIQSAYQQQRPVLIETGSVSLSELYSRLLLQNGIVHNLLNARSEVKEAEIIRDAGQLGTVTVATSMAGRGTDIRLGKGALEKGGLLVIGTERMSNRRVDNQLRGRAGRHGEPGETMFFASLDDRIVIENGAKKLQRIQKRLESKVHLKKRAFGREIKSYRLRLAVLNAQKTATNKERAQRIGSIQYDDVQRRQQSAIYQFRNQIITAEYEDLLSLFHKLINQSIEQLLSTKDLTLEILIDFITNNINYNFNQVELLEEILNHKRELQLLLRELIDERLNEQLTSLSEMQRGYFLRLSILHALDNAWIEQVDNLHQLRGVIVSRSKAQHDPISEYQIEAVRSFDQMRHNFWQLALQNMMLSILTFKADGSIDLSFP